MRRRRKEYHTTATLVHHVLLAHPVALGASILALLNEAGCDTETLDPHGMFNAVALCLNDEALKCLGMDELERSEIETEFPVPLAL